MNLFRALHCSKACIGLTARFVVFYVVVMQQVSTAFIKHQNQHKQT